MYLLDLQEPAREVQVGRRLARPVGGGGPGSSVDGSDLEHRLHPSPGHGYGDGVRLLQVFASHREEECEGLDQPSAIPMAADGVRHRQPAWTDRWAWERKDWPPRLRRLTQRCPGPWPIAPPAGAPGRRSCSGSTSTSTWLTMTDTARSVRGAGFGASMRPSNWASPLTAVATFFKSCAVMAMNSASSRADAERRCSASRRWLA